MSSGGQRLPQWTLNACSACAGDYEDPDRTAGTLEAEDDEQLLQVPQHENAQERSENGDEFPADEA